MVGQENGLAKDWVGGGFAAAAFTSVRRPVVSLSFVFSLLQNNRIASFFSHKFNVLSSQHILKVLLKIREAGAIGKI